MPTFVERETVRAVDRSARDAISSRSAVTRSSSSRNAMYRPLANAIPALRADAGPPWVASLTSRTRPFRGTSTLGSEPSSTTMSSQSASVCPATDAIACRKRSGRLRVGSRTLKRDTCASSIYQLAQVSVAHNPCHPDVSVLVGLLECDCHNRQREARAQRAPGSTPMRRVPGAPRNGCCDIGVSSSYGAHQSRFSSR
jgi:hypothetical protein